MGTLYTSDGRTITPHTELVSVGEALTAGGRLVDAAGAALQTIDFMGGLLVGPYALPMNVILYGTWYPTQKEILQPYWDSGQLPRPPEPTVALETVDPAAASSSLLPIAAGAALAFFLFRKR